MTPANQHLEPQAIDAFIDRELTREELRSVEQHVADCHACALRVLSAMELKRVTAVAALRLAPSGVALERLTAQVRSSGRTKTKRRALSFVLPAAAWAAIAACLLVTIALAAWQLGRGENALSAELLDQHLVTLSSGATPQVISTDRHTVKPWFQGKLPFSFNLPDATELPPGAVLKGADLTYLEGHPAALLLFSIRKHQVSVFVTETKRIVSRSAVLSKSGFTISSAKSGQLTLMAISDVNPKDLRFLVSALTRAQD